MTPAEFREARHTLGLTQTQAAAMLGRTLRNIQQWEGSEREIDGAAALLLRAYIAGYRPADWPN